MADGAGGRIGRTGKTRRGAPLSSNVMTGFCRITVVAPTVRVDVALPEDVPLAELLPDVLRMADQWQSEGAHAGFVLARLDGGELDTGVSLSAQDVHSGDLLYLRPATELLPPPVYDDVVDAIATSVGEDRRMWGGAHFKQVGLAVGAALLGIGAFILYSPLDPAPMHGTAGGVAAAFALLLVIAGGARSRIYGDHVGGAVLAAGSVLYAFLAGLGLPPEDVHQVDLPGGGTSAYYTYGMPHFTAACCAALVFGLAGTVLLEKYAAASLAGTITAGIGAAAGAVGLATGAAAPELAAGAGTFAVAVIGFLPGLALRFVRFPMPALIDGTPQVGVGAQRARLPAGSDDPIDFGDIERRAARGHDLLTGLVAACAFTVLICAVPLVFATPGTDGGPWAIGMAAVLGLALFSRARLFRRAGQVGALFWGGGLTCALVLVGAGMHVSPGARSTWYFGVVLLAALIMLGVGTTLPERRLSPRWARTVDLLDGLALAAVVPVLLGVLEVYGKMPSVIH